MTIRPILGFPDPRLRAAAAAVEVFDDALAGLAGDLADTLHAARAIGITAPHIGVLRRVVVIALPEEGRLRTYVNPQIDWASPERIRHEEGSVSMPGVTDAVERHARLRLRYRDLAGAEHTEEANGFLAICLQHEIDQLDGIFWIYRLSRLKRDRLVKRFEKLQRPSPGG